MMHRPPLRSLMLTLGMMMACLACGSGSSGFQPRTAELTAILASAESGMCEIAPGGIEVCGEEAGPGDGAVCAAQGPGCSFVLSVDLRGLDPGSVLIGAVEPEDLSLPWRTSSNSLGPANEAGELSGDLSFVTDIAPGTIGLRAILLYPAGNAPPSLGADGIDVNLLAELDAPRADVLVSWPIEAP